MKESMVNLIEDMQEVKTAYPTLEITEVLRLFHIDSTKELTTAIDALRLKYGG